MQSPILQVEALSSRYGRAQVLFGIELQARAGEVLALLGRNGAGKSTLLKSIMGIVPAASGAIRFGGIRIEHLPPFRIARMGLGYVPEDRCIFTGLTVSENLDAGWQPVRDGMPQWRKQRIYELFPALVELRERRGGHLSGGEQQMLCIARTLMGNPRCLLLDEPSEGLAPVIVEQLVATVRELKCAGVAMLISEQNMRFAAAVADRACVIERGRIRYEGTIQELAAGDAYARHLQP